MTSNANDLPTNNLNVNEIKNFTPPISLELGSGKEDDYTYSKTLSKLLWRFVRVAVPDQEQVYFSDIEMLDTLMLYGSITRTAKKCKLSVSYVSNRVNAIFKQLDQRMSEWETMRTIYEGEKQIADMEAYLEKLSQRKAELIQRKEELQSQINDETKIVRGMTMTNAEKRARDNQVYLRECKMNKKND